MSYDLSFDRKTATLLAVCTAAIILLLVAAGFLLGAQYRRPTRSAVIAPVKMPLPPEPQKPALPTTPPLPALVEASASSAISPEAKPDNALPSPAVTPAIPSTAPKDVATKLPAAPAYNLQFGAFREQANADAAVKQLKVKKVKAVVVPKEDAAGDTWYTVRFGDYPTLSAASAAAVPLRASTQQSIFIRPANRP